MSKLLFSHIETGKIFSLPAALSVCRVSSRFYYAPLDIKRRKACLNTKQKLYAFEMPIFYDISTLHLQAVVFDTVYV